MNLMTSIISLSYADDFNLITTNKHTRQRLITRLNALTASMNLKLKPSKCSSLSIVSSPAKPIPLTISDTPISTLFDKPHKYLGSTIGHSASSSAGFDFLHNKLSSILSNIDSSLVHPEYKLKIYTAYAFPALRFHLIAHDLTKTQPSTLDALPTRFFFLILALTSSLRNDIHSLRLCLSQHTYHNITLFSMSRLFLRSTFSIP